MTFKSCFGCVAPKRHPGCHGSCKEYKDERAAYDERKAIYDREQGINIALYTSRNEKVYKALKDRRTKKI